MDFSNLRVSELIKLGTVCEENVREISKMLGIRMFSIYGCVLPFGKYFFLKNIESGKKKSFDLFPIPHTRICFHGDSTCDGPNFDNEQIRFN